MQLVTASHDTRDAGVPLIPCPVSVLNVRPWLYPTVVAVHTHLFSIFPFLPPENHGSDYIVVDTTSLPPYPSL